MDTLLNAALMGVVEGLTEFLPVSSTGHLILTGEVLGLDGIKADTFTMVIQLGAILAVVILYWPRFIGLLFPARSQSPARAQNSPGFYGLRGLGLLFLTSLPAALLGLMAHNAIKNHFTPATVVSALSVGAILMLLVEQVISRRLAKNKDDGLASLDQLSPRTALGIGLFQCLALWPGFSRSASTIMGGMLLGLRRELAAEYSFIAAVPLLCGAALFDLLDSLRTLHSVDILFFLTGTAFAFVFAVLAIKTFITLLGKTTLRPFALYRLMLAIPVYWFMVR